MCGAITVGYMHICICVHILYGPLLGSAGALVGESSAQSGEYNLHRTKTSHSTKADLCGPGLKFLATTIYNRRHSYHDPKDIAPTRPQETSWLMYLYKGSRGPCYLVALRLQCRVMASEARVLRQVVFGPPGLIMWAFLQHDAALIDLGALSQVEMLLFS